MALSSKERQQKYRNKNKGKSARLDMIVDLSTAIKIEDMALHGNVSKKDFLITLIDKEYRRLLNDKETGFDDWLAELQRERVAKLIADNLELFDDIDDTLHGNDWKAK